MSHEQKSLPYHVTRRISFGYGAADPEHEQAILESLCEGMVRANCIMLDLDPEAYPCCLQCGSIDYVPPENCKVINFRTGKALDPNCQHVHGAFALVHRKKGTCIDLACYMCAVFRVKENDPNAVVLIDPIFTPGGQRVPNAWHATVRRGDGTIVDPMLTAANSITNTPMAVGGAAVEPPACNCGS